MAPKKRAKDSVSRRDLNGKLGKTEEAESERKLLYFAAKKIHFWLDFPLQHHRMRFSREKFQIPGIFEGEKVLSGLRERSPSRKNLAVGESQLETASRVSRP